MRVFPAHQRASAPPRRGRRPARVPASHSTTRAAQGAGTRVCESLFSTTFCNSYGQYTCAADTCSSFHFLSTSAFQNMPNNKTSPHSLGCVRGSLLSSPERYFLVRSPCPSKTRGLPGHLAWRLYRRLHLACAFLEKPACLASPLPSWW